MKEEKQLMIAGWVILLIAMFLDILNLNNILVRGIYSISAIIFAIIIFSPKSN